MIPVKIDDHSYEQSLAGLAADGISIFTLENDSIRGAMVSGTRMVAEMKQNHGLGLLETLVLGQAYLAAALLSVTIKGEDRLVIRLEAEGACQGYSVECGADGRVRGRLFSPPIEPKRELTSLDTAQLVDAGFLTVTRHQAGRTEPVSGTVRIRSGRIAEDLAWYFLESEQLRTSFTVGIQFDKQGRVGGAGGMYLQVLPFARDDALDRIERLVYSMPQLGQSFAEGHSRVDLMLRMFPFFDLNMLEERPLSFSCPCSKERLGAFLTALPEAERADVREHGPFPLEIRCQNCGSAYFFDKTEVDILCPPG